MTALPDINGLIKETRKYEFADGLRDLQFGLMFISYGLIEWFVFRPAWFKLILSLKANPGPWSIWFVMIVLFLLPIIVVLGMIRIMDYARRRWLWKDSGYVKPSHFAISRRSNVLAALVLLAVLASGLGIYRFAEIDDQFPWRLIWTAISWGFDVSFIDMGRSLGIRRYPWLGAICGLASIPLLFVRLSLEMTPLVICLIWGIAFTVSACFAIRGFWQDVQKAKDNG